MDRWACVDLRAPPASPVTPILRGFTPHVEPCAGEPGVFWLDASGLRRLYPSLARWGEGLRNALLQHQLDAVVVIGFSRFGTYALAKVLRGVVVLRDAASERRALSRVPIAHLHWDSALRQRLDQLGVRTVEDFLRLPAADLRARFGEHAHTLHRLAQDTLWRPLDPDEPEAMYAAQTSLDWPEDNAERLLFYAKQLLDPLLARLAKDQRALTQLHLRCVLHSRGILHEALAPAAPTLESAQLLELLRLRLLRLRLPSGVVELHLRADWIAATPEQLRLFRPNPRRDVDAAHRALARLRAELGDQAVQMAAPANGHLPEHAFSLQNYTQYKTPSPELIRAAALVRRVYTPARPLPARPRREPDGWLVGGLEPGPAVRSAGPYVLSGGWWVSTVTRDYYFVETARGDALWVYYDRKRHAWLLQGRVE